MLYLLCDYVACSALEYIRTSDPLPSFSRAVPTRPLPTKVNACVTFDVQVISAKALATFGLSEC